MRSRATYALFGILATVVGMATGHFVASLLNPAASPVLAVGSQVIDLTPTNLKEWAIAHFGTNDKHVLLGSVVVGVIVLAAIAGLLTRRRFRYGATMLFVLVAVAAYTALSRPEAELVDIIPSVLTVTAGIGSLYWLDRVYRLSHTAQERNADPEAQGTEPVRGSRRTVLVAGGIVAVAAAVMGGAGKLIGNLRAKPEDLSLPTAAKPLPPLPRGLESTYPGISAFQTPTNTFYRVDTRLDVPVIDSDSWSLTVDGDVKKQLKLSFADLTSMPLIERDITLTCVSNSVGGHYMGSARWLGVRLMDILDMAGIGTDSDQLLATDFDGMTIGTPLALATDGRDAMIAIAMNGEQLPRAHGFPARVIIPGLYGFISATKWVERLTLTTYAAQESYWTHRKWATDAPIKISSRIDTPRALSTVKAGNTFIGGVAWAQQNGGVGKVQVRVDGGAWQEAKLGPSAGNDYWRQWYFPWKAEAGQRTISCRVIDGQGEVQSPALAEPFPSGSSGVEQLLVNVA